MSTRRTRLAGCIFSAVLILTSCGGGSGTASSESLIEGTASAGHPIAGQVWVKDAGGAVTGPVAISPSGRFTIPATTLKPPFMLKAQGRVNGRAVTMYSAGWAAGTTNINPMTDLSLHVAAGAGTVESLWSAPSTPGSALDAGSLQAASASVRQLLMPFLEANGAGSADPFTEPVRLGVGLDAVFDRLWIERDLATERVTVTSRITGETLLTSAPEHLGSAMLNLADHPALTGGAAVTLSWYSPSGMAFGTGYDNVAEEIAGTCITFGEPDAIIGTGNITRYANIEVIEDMSHMTQHLGVSATAKMRMGLYSGSGKATYASTSVRDSTSVFVAVYTEVIGHQFKLQNPRLLDDRRSQLTRDAAGFRDSCGDSFLSTITTGGKMVGILRITTTSDKEKTAVTANVKAKSLVFNSGSASMRATMSSLVQQYQANITMFEVGPADASSITNYDAFMDAFEGFPAKVEACISSWRNCAYLVTFEDYVHITDAQTHSGAKTAAMAQLIGYDTEYELLQARITDMQARPNLYERPDISLADALGKISTDLSRVQDAAQACETDSNNCTVPPNLLEPATVNLPLRKLITTSNCTDYKTNFPTAAIDGEYRMYFANDSQLQSPFYLYCLGMSGTTPTEYLTLKLTSPPSTSPSYNFSSSVGRGDAFTVFNKLRVWVNPSELAIVRDDHTFATTRWVAQPEAGTGDAAMPYGEAYTSYIHSDWDAAKQGHANIDLTGTPFALAASAQWTLSGSGSEFTNWHTSSCGTRPNCTAPVVIGSGRQSAQLHIAGYPGSVKPTADLRLVLAQ